MAAGVSGILRLYSAAVGGGGDSAAIFVQLCVFSLARTLIRSEGARPDRGRRSGTPACQPLTRQRSHREPAATAVRSGAEAACWCLLSCSAATCGCGKPSGHRQGCEAKPQQEIDLHLVQTVKMLQDINFFFDRRTFPLTSGHLVQNFGSSRLENFSCACRKETFNSD